MKKMLLFCTVILFCSCATQRISQFTAFAGAGKSFTDAADKLALEAGKIAINMDSELLLQERDQFDEQERIRVYNERTKALDSLLSVISSYRVHNSLINSYFQILNQLADTKGPSNLPDQLSSIVNSLQKIHPDIENAGFGSSAVKDFTSVAAPIVISAFKQKVLEDELNRNARTIERELDLQCAFLKALSGQMKSDMMLLNKYRDFQYVTLPYISKMGSKEEWKEKRREVLTSGQSFDLADKADLAAVTLKNSFLDLIRNKTGDNGYKSLFNDINALLDLVEVARKYSSN